MITLQIIHDVPNYDSWKKAFDSDPINRKAAGVKSYRIYRPADNLNLVIVELDFENRNDLDITLVVLQNLWNKVQGSIINNPATNIFEIVESKHI